MRELFHLIPIPLYSTKPIDPSNLSQPLSPNGNPINLSRYLRKGAVHSTLIEFQEFVDGVLKDDALTPTQRSTAIEDRALDILVAWGKVYLAALITSANLPTLTGDLLSMLKPFEDSVEVTVLLAMASQYNLKEKTKQDVSRGWRFGE